jgi:8-oxo-dGTP diphosphatase
MNRLKRSVAGIALEGRKIFIARRIMKGDMGGKWEFPGGKVEEGESDEEALVREFDEEFGVAVNPGPFLGSASFEHRGIPRLLKAYRIFFPGGASPGLENLKLREHTEWRWVAIDEIQSLDFAPSDLKLLPGLERFV